MENNIVIILTDGNFYFSCSQIEGIKKPTTCKKFCHIKDCPAKNSEYIQQFYRALECADCGALLDYGYLVVIKLLEKENLIDENFDPLCCSCFRSRKRIINV